MEFIFAQPTTKMVGTKNFNASTRWKSILVGDKFQTWLVMLTVTLGEWQWFNNCRHLSSTVVNCRQLSSTFVNCRQLSSTVVNILVVTEPLKPKCCVWCVCAFLCEGIPFYVVKFCRDPALSRAKAIGPNQWRSWWEAKGSGPVIKYLLCLIIKSW